MLLSIVIPVYNVEKYLVKCLESIIENKSEEVEILLINDGSIDNSKVICEAYRELDNRIKFINKKNEGCSTTRNLGIKLAKGKYIWFIDSDDYVLSNSIKYIIEDLKFNYRELIVFGQTLVDANYKVIEENIPRKDLDVYSQMKIFNGPCNKIYNKSILVENNIFFPENSHLGEDMAFNFKYMYYIKKIEVIEQTFYVYRLANGVTSNIEKRKEVFLAFDDIFKFYKEKNIFYKNKEILKKYYEKNAIFYPYNLILSSNLDKKEKLKKIKELNKELNKRKNIFNTRFLIIQIYYYLKYRLDFFRPYYRKIKKFLKV